LSVAGAADGKIIIIRRIDTAAFTLTVHNAGPAANDIYVMPSGGLQDVICWYEDGNWHYGVSWTTQTPE
jgi:hypothetical protein